MSNPKLDLTEEKQLANAKKFRDYGISMGDKELVRDMDIEIEILTNRITNSGSSPVTNQQPEGGKPVNKFTDLVSTTLTKVFNAFRKKDGEEVTQKVLIKGTPGVCEQYNSANGLITQFDLLGTLLYDAGLNPGRKIVMQGLTGEQALEILTKKPLAVPTAVKDKQPEMVEGKWVNALEFEVTYRDFKNSLDASKAMGYLNLQVGKLETVKDVLKAAKRCGRMSSEFYIVVCPSGRVYNGLTNRQYAVSPDWTYTIKTSSAKDGAIDIDPTFGNLIGLPIGGMYGKATAGKGEGQLKGKATVAEKSLRTDVIFHDGEKPEVTLGVKYLGLGSPCHNGSEVYTDLMIVNKSLTMVKFLLGVFHKDKEEIVLGVKAHQDTAKLSSSIMEKALIEDANYSQAVQLGMAREYARKMGLPGREGKKSGSTIMVMAQKGVDACLHPLVTALFSLFIIGKTGTIANHYRARIPGGARMYYELWDSACWDASLEPKGREVTITYTVDGELIGLVSKVLWPEMKEATGGSDFDDSWLTLAFRGITKSMLKGMDKDFPGMGSLTTTLVAWLFRQPDGPGDGLPVGIKFGKNYIDRKGVMHGPEEIFEEAFSGEVGKTIFTEITEHVLMVRKISAMLPELESIWQKSHARNPKWINRKAPRMPNPEAAYTPGDLDFFTSKVEKSKVSHTVDSSAWHKATTKGVKCQSIGGTANLLAKILADVMSGKISLDLHTMRASDIAQLRYVGWMLYYGGLEAIVDFNNMGKLPKDREINGIVITGKQLVEKLFWIHFDTVKLIDTIEYSHLFGGEGHKARMGKINGVNAFKLCNELSTANFKHREVENWYGVEESKRAKVLEVFKANLKANHLTDEGRIAIAAVCGIKVYKSYLTEFRDGIYKTMKQARTGTHLNTVAYQLRWIETLLLKLGIGSKEDLKGVTAKFIPEEVRPALSRVLTIKADTQESRWRSIVLETLSYVTDEAKALAFFKALTYVDLVQLRVSGQGHTYAGIFDSEEYLGWRTQARTGLQALKLLREVEAGKNITLDENNPIHAEVNHILETGYASSVWGPVELDSAWKLRTFCNVPKGQVVGYDETGSEVRDSSWTICGQTYQEWYATVWQDVVGEFIEIAHARKNGGAV